MSQEPTTKRLPRPDLRVNPSKWSAAEKGVTTSRVAIIATVAAVIGGIGLVFLYPYVNIDKYRNIQQVNRAGINPDDVQPTGLPAWRDPFDRKKSG